MDELSASDDPQNCLRRGVKAPKGAGKEAWNRERDVLVLPCVNGCDGVRVWIKHFNSRWILEQLVSHVQQQQKMSFLSPLGC